jgi:SAM-dependent methyltransferase
MSVTCRLCKSTDVVKVLHLPCVPSNVQALLTKDQLGKDRPVEFQVYQCQCCSLVQAPVQLNVNYYDDYLMSTTFSSQLADYLDNLAEEFIGQYNLKDGRVLDVGCGDGAFMYPFSRRGISVVGIEPSDRSRQVAHQAGFEVYPGYMTADTVIPSGPFDAFVSRQVLEHVDDIAGMLTGLRKNLVPGGVGIIEVPRLEKAIDDLRFYDFFPDHVNYFTLDSLRTALEINGYEVLDLRSTMYDEYNVAIVRAVTPIDLFTVQNNISALVKEIDQLFVQCKQQNKITAMWGAGAKGLSIMSNLNVGNIDHLIDSDSNKQGRYTAISELLIEPADILKTAKVDVLVVTAVAYQQIILDKLINQYHYTGELYLLQQSGLKKVQ